MIDEIVTACTAGAAEAAEALGRAFGATVTLTVAAPRAAEGAPGLTGPGLMLLLIREPASIVVALPAAGGLLPDWCRQPDPTGQSKLSTLAQELGIIVLPESLAPQDFKTVWVENLAETLEQADIKGEAMLVPVEWSEGDRHGTLGIVFPIVAVEAIATESAAPAVPPGIAAPRAAAPVPAAPPRGAPLRRELPLYTRSLLRVRVPVVVTLAEKRQPLGHVIELSPGAIIQFEKSCEEMLELSVNNRSVAVGEAVKVGDKFGLRITAITLPEERFRPIGQPAGRGNNSCR
jgi:flagellar motor switch/type III secretory pathway protein FliN